MAGGSRKVACSLCRWFIAEPKLCGHAIAATSRFSDEGERIYGQIPVADMRRAGAPCAGGRLFIRDERPPNWVWNMAPDWMRKGMGVRRG